MSIVLVIEFGPSESPRIEAAAKVAMRFPAYSLENKVHRVDVTVTPQNWPDVDALWTIVERLTSTRCTVNGAPWNWHLWREISDIFTCNRTRAESPNPYHYCVGQETPTSDPQFMGCRNAGGASFNRVMLSLVVGYVPEWWKFGTLDPDRKSFLVDKDEIIRRVEHGSRIAKECPSWSMDRVRAVVARLPSVLVIGEDWKLRYSELDPSQVLGVAPNWPKSMKDGLNLNDFLEKL